MKIALALAATLLFAETATAAPKKLDCGNGASHLKATAYGGTATC